MCFFVLLPLFALKASDVQNFNNNWRFHLGHAEYAYLSAFDDSGWVKLHLPHDWAIAGPFDPNGSADTGKLPWQGEGWYRKTFNWEGAWEGKQLTLLFDGVMAFPKVYVNGKLAGEWDNGYNSFTVNITDYLSPDSENTIAVHVDTRQHDSRWYPGAGIYRKVSLVVEENIHIPVWGVSVTTPAVRENWTDVRILTEVKNAGANADSLTLISTIKNPEGKALVSDSLRVRVSAGEEDIYEQWMTLTNPRRWDIETPHLYTVHSVLVGANGVADSEVTSFGIRTFVFTSSEGFYLNGRKVQLKGVNLHHDHGPLGGAFYTRAMERQLQIMQEMGVNAVRNSHNIAAPEMLELCDKMGILVFNEAFDKWDGKADILPGTDFEEFMERNLRNFVKRDRNHPSVILWSVGNEMRDVQGNYDDGLQKLATAVNIVAKYDPTRPVTIANDQEGGVRWRHFDYYDVHSWNYGRRYLPARQAEPGKAVIISESASTLSTRGYYELPLPKDKGDYPGTGQMSSYDLNAPWWAEIPDIDFYYQEEDPYVVGEFVWTGFDYLGEPTPYNDYWAKEENIPQSETARSSYFGIVDLCGLKKDRYYLYKSYWKPDETTVHILPHWNWQGREGDTIPVFVYTNGDCAELFINGNSQGTQCKKPKSENVTERYRLMWHSTTYEPGEVKAIAYKEGSAIGEAIVSTAGEPALIQLNADRAELKANGEDLAYITVEVLDKDGKLCPLAENEIAFKVSGKGQFLAAGNGNPQSLVPFQSKSRQIFYGKAMVIIKTTEVSGDIVVEATAPGLKNGKITLKSR